jgi:hypothetical protein
MLNRTSRSQNVPQDDLVASGLSGLQLAAARFDPQKGTRFSTVATAWVGQHINRSGWVWAGWDWLGVPAAVLSDPLLLRTMRRGVAGDPMVSVCVCRHGCSRLVFAAWRHSPVSTQSLQCTHQLHCSPASGTVCYQDRDCAVRLALLSCLLCVLQVH